MTPAAELGALERAQVERVRERIAAEIDAAGGWIGFDRYMELALYAPGLGYYSAGAHKLGPGGDFTTAPEVSRLFGGCVARQCADILAIEQDAARGRQLQARDHPQRRGLAAAGGAENDEERAVLHGEVDALHRVKRPE